MGVVNMKTEVVIQVNKRKKVTKEALVVEGFKEKYIKVDLVDEDDHVFELKWNGYMFEGTFLEMSMTCQYNVERDFSATKTAKGTGRKPVVARRSRSGRPVSMQD
ncbi:MAG: hypothetical protein HOB15_04930 [Flavobacteriales bacterium]|jgi:hypothetical protein|nr:hypothetical protein [Flavobacteriales bacterium]